MPELKDLLDELSFVEHVEGGGSSLNIGVDEIHVPFVVEIVEAAGWEVEYGPTNNNTLPDGDAFIGVGEADTPDTPIVVAPFGGCDHDDLYKKGYDVNTVKVPAVDHVDHDMTLLAWAFEDSDAAEFFEIYGSSRVEPGEVADIGSVDRVPHGSIVAGE